MSQIKFEQLSTHCHIGKTIFEHADLLGVKIPTSCYRNGRCHECIVEIKGGSANLSSPSDKELFLQGNFRLACQAKVNKISSDIHFGLSRKQRQILTSFTSQEFEVFPRITNKNGTVYSENSALSDYEGFIYGMAIDIGTTTVAFNIVNLESGQIIYTGSFENPQNFGGSDIMRRISYDSTPFRGELQKAIISSINHEIRNACRLLRIRRKHIYEILVVGNSTMRDLFFGLDIQSIGQKPYKSLTEHELNQGKRHSTTLYSTAKELGIQMSQQGLVYGVPIIASHIGADVAADLIATRMDVADDKIQMLIDIGTNTEVVIGNKHGMLAASCPAGPAFEGGEVKHGMPGYAGAIESLTILEDHSIKYKTINDQAPSGICGSGLIDVIAELRRTGQLNPLGVFTDNSKEFLIEKDRHITIDRHDLSALAQAKSANYCGQYIAAKKYGIQFSNVQTIFLAGAFANYINISNAQSIGLIPSINQSHFVRSGNASLLGATILLLSTKKRQSLKALIKKIRHIELETEPDFFDIFVEGCMFQPMTN